MISFLHAADLHLGMRLTRFDPAIAGKVREGRFSALDNILVKARALKVDFVVIAGDLFDDATVDRSTAARAFEMLSSLPMPVYVLPGNHDPLVAGGVWDRPPWNQADACRLSVLAEAAPRQAMPGLMLLPCPLLRKTSMNDPTAWIAQTPATPTMLRIGVAHGSLKTRADLPPDDHLIARHAADDLGLDYLALGHWHSRSLYPDRHGVERTAYPGVHEPMRFQGNAASQTGWAPYSSGASRSEFLDAGKGEVLHVKIATPGAPPVIEPVEVGHFHWQEENHELTTLEGLERLIEDVAQRPRRECSLLKLHVSGVLDAESMMRLEELREILHNRYLLGELDDVNLHLKPTDQEIHEVAGRGVLESVLEKLLVETRSSQVPQRQVAERALLLLYQIGREVIA